jgi:uncharacterized protein YraI
MVILLLLVVMPGLFTRADFGSNWSVTFYNSNNFSGSPSTVTGFNEINFNWGSTPPEIPIGTPVPGISASNISAIFTSTQNLNAGSYNFVLSVEDGGQISIDGNIILDKLIDQPSAVTYTIPYTIGTSGAHNITVKFVKYTGTSSIQFQWFLQGTAGVTGTPTPAPTAVPPAIGSIFYVKGLALRTGPYLGASYIGVALAGQTYTPSARNRDEGIYNWYFVTVGEKSGWISGKYLNFTGDPNALPVRSTVFESIDGAPDLGVIGSTRSNMNLRRRPSERSDLLAKIPWGAEVSVLGRTVQGGKNFWLHVRYKDQVGWIIASYVSVRGDIGSVPVR